MSILSEEHRRGAIIMASLIAMLGMQGCAHVLFPVEEPVSEVIYLDTEDGWQIALHHFGPPEGEPTRGTPLIICHGISSNRYNWDLSEELSFPRYIAELGFDVYLLELRGSGASEKPTWFGEKSYEYSFDDYVLYDLPAAIDYVAATTPGGKVQWVGHSMGTMVMYAYLQRMGSEKIQSVLAVGSPPSLFDGNESLSLGVSLFPLVDWFYRELPAAVIASLGAPLAHPGWNSPMHILWNYDNVDPDIARIASAHAVDNLSSGVVRQLVGPDLTGEFRSSDGRYNYTQGLSAIEVPIFFVVGALDQLAPPTTMLSAYRRVGSADKRIEILSRANGYLHDYGHVDMVLGESAPAEVFPLLAGWLVSHDVH